MIKRLILALIFLAIVVGGLVGFNLFRAKAIKDFFATMQQPAQTVSTVTVEPMTWTPGIEAIGSANASSGVDLTFQVDGLVKNIAFAANQKIKEGTVLVQLDDSIQKADLVAAKAEAVLSEQNLKRAQTLRTQGVGAISNVETTAASAASAEAQVAKLQAVLDQKTVTAPFSGVIGIPKVDVGQYVTPGTVIASLQNIDTMRIDFTVPEQAISQLELGQVIHAGATANALDFSGKITGIDPKIDPTTRLVAVRAEVANPDGKLTPGQFVQVRVELPTEDNVIALVQTSIVSSLYGDYVFVVRPQKKTEDAAKPDAAKPDTTKPTDAEKSAETLQVDQVFVQLGRRSKGLVEITKGLEKGDVIVTAGQNRLSPKMRVVIDNTVNPADSGA